MAVVEYEAVSRESQGLTSKFLLSFLLLKDIEFNKYFGMGVSVYMLAGLFINRYFIVHL